MGKGAIFEIGFHKARTLQEIMQLYKPVPELIPKLDELCEVINAAFKVYTLYIPLKPLKISNDTDIQAA